MAVCGPRGKLCAMDNASLTLVMALAAGVLCQAVARPLRIPGIVLLLATGMVLGPSGLNWVRPSELGEGLLAIVHLAVAVILFEGGLNLEISRLRRSQAPIQRLVSVGALLTLVGAGAAAHLLLGWDWLTAGLFGSLVVVTGPTVIGPLVREARLRPKLATVLEAEGVLIDPIGALLAVLALEIALAPGSSALASEALELVYRIGLGVCGGLLGGVVLALLLRSSWLPEGLKNIAALAAVLLLFESCEAVLEHSGLLAVTLAGVVVGNVRTRVDRDLREFKDQLSVLLIGLIFILLAADVSIGNLRDLGWRGVGVVALLITVVRPVNALLCTLGSSLSWRERVLIGWIAPRGIVAAAVASITAVTLDAHGLPGGAELRALVFLTITGTVLAAGLTVLPLAHVLGVRLPQRQTVAILGAEGLGIALARELSAGGASVVLLDSNPQYCRAAEESGLAVVFGNALEERVLERARFSLVGTAVGLTANESLNGLFASRAAELFGVPRRYVAATATSSGVTPEMLRSQGTKLLFEAPHDVERWNVRARHGEMSVEHFIWNGPVEGAEDLPRTEKLLLLALQRGSSVMPMSDDLSPQPGDIASVALYVPERDEVHQILKSRGWEPA